MGSCRPAPKPKRRPRMENDTPKTTNKKTLAALEKVFAAEIAGRLPFQSKAKVFRELRDAGLLTPMERTFGSGWSAITVSGYELTHAGRITYCASCGDADV